MMSINSKIEAISDALTLGRLAYLRISVKHHYSKHDIDLQEKIENTNKMLHTRIALLQSLRLLHLN